MDPIASDVVIDEAYRWPCDRRRPRRHMVLVGGEYTSVECGISLGCPLSPLVGGLYLQLLKDEVKRLCMFHARYMDDSVILSKTRWQLRRAIQRMNSILEELKLEKHPNKTPMGRIDRRFGFLGRRLVANCLQFWPTTPQLVPDTNGTAVYVT